MSIKSPSNDDWIRYVPEIHPSGLRQFGGPNTTGDAWRHGAYKGETSASNPLRRHVATATHVSTRRDANLDRAWKGCGKSKRDDAIANGFDVGPPTAQPVVEGFGGTNWGAHGRAMSPSILDLGSSSTRLPSPNRRSSATTLSFSAGFIEQVE